MPKVSDERLIETLLETGSVRATAQKVKLTPSAVYKRLREPVFRERYEQAQDGIISAVAGSLTQALDGAVETLATICANPINAPGLRISAADSLLRHGLKYVEASNILRRLAELEAAQDD